MAKWWKVFEIIIISLHDRIQAIQTKAQVYEIFSSSRILFLDYFVIFIYYYYYLVVHVY